MEQAETTLVSGVASSKLAHRYRVSLKGGTGVPLVNAQDARATIELTHYGSDDWRFNPRSIEG